MRSATEPKWVPRNPFSGRLPLTALILALILAPAASIAQGIGTVVIENGTVHPVSGEPFVGTVVIDEGVISAVGPDVAAPGGEGSETEGEIRLIDATDLHVYPGMVDALSQVGLLEVGAVSATDDRAEMGTYNPHLSALTAVHPASEVIPVTRSNGITHALVAPRTDGDGVIAGQAALIQLDGWTAAEMAIEPSVAMVIDWPEIRTRRFSFLTFSMEESPFTEAKEKAEESRNELRDWLEAARHYRQAVESESDRLEVDLRLAALAGVLDGGQPVILIANSRRDIESAVAFAEEQGLRMILAGGLNAGEVADMLAEKGIPVILGLTQSLPREQDDPYDKPFDNAARLVDAGVRIAFGSGAGGGFGPGGPHGSRTTMYQAAMAAAYGLSPEDALRAMTLWPAEILGFADRLGSIEVGKLANLVVTDGDPLEITSNVQHLIIGGREIGTDDRQRRLYDKHRGRPLPEAPSDTGRP